VRDAYEICKKCDEGLGAYFERYGYVRLGFF